MAEFTDYMLSTLLACRHFYLPVQIATINEYILIGKKIKIQVFHDRAIVLCDIKNDKITSYFFPLPPAKHIHHYHHCHIQTRFANITSKLLKPATGVQKPHDGALCYSMQFQTCCTSGRYF